MTGHLIVNGFLASAKFADLYALLTAAFQKRGVRLEAYANTDFLTPLGDCPRPTSTAGTTPRPDFVLFWDKDASLARRFEQAGIPVFNSAAAIETCDDKIRTAEALARAGVPTPRTIPAPLTFDGIGYTRLDFLARAGEELGYPFVLKEAFGSFGQQVHLIQTPEEARDVVATLGARRFLLQEFIASSRGRDLRVNVVGDRVRATIYRENKRDFRSNVTLGGTAADFSPTAAQAAAAVAAAKAVGATFAGVDVLFGPGGEPLVCEVNSNPHFRSTLDATGVNLADHIAEVVVQA